MEQKPNTTGKKQFNVYEMVTKTILQSMMRGDIPWRNVWTAKKEHEHPFVNHFTGKPYSFLNTLLLQKPGRYATIKQINEKKGTVNKGAKSCPVIYWGEYIPKEKKEEAKRIEEEGGDISSLKVKFPKFYRVFNIDDTSLKDTVKPAVQEEKTMEKAQSPTLLADTAILCYRNEYGVTVNDEANEISYDIGTDTVCVPRKEEFTYEEDWYAALCGQLVHSTATESRCARATEAKKLSAGEVSVKEELIAEIGASMVLSAAGLTRKETKTQTAAVCAKWIAEMENDYRLIVTASYGAEKAAKLILGELAQ